MDKTLKYLRLICSKIFWKQLKQAISLFFTDNSWGILNLGSLGKGVTIRPSVILANSQNIFIGDHVEIQRHVYIMAGETSAIHIGKHTMIAPGAFITAGNHGFKKESLIRIQKGKEADVVIGDDVFIGAYSIILPGVIIGDGAIIGAGAVIRRNVGSNDIIAAQHSKTFGKRII